MKDANQTFNSSRTIALLILFYGVIFFTLFFIGQKLQNTHHVLNVTQLNFESKAQERLEILEQFFYSFNSTIDAIQANPDFQTYIATSQDKQSVTELFLTLQKTLNCASQIDFIDAKGDEQIKVIGPATVHSTPAITQAHAIDQLNNQVHTDFFQKFASLPKGKVGISQIEKSAIPTTNSPIKHTIFRYGAPVYDGSTFKGVLVLHVCLKDFLKLFAQTTLYDVYIADPNGEFILQPNTPPAASLQLTSLQEMFDHTTAQNILHNYQYLAENLYSQKFTILDNPTPYYLILKASFTGSNFYPFELYQTLLISLLLASALTLPIALRLVRSQQQVVAHLDYISHTDSLTQLPNKFSLLEDLPNQEQAELILLSIDHFFELNKVYGYEQIDTLLQDFAHHLKTLSKTCGYQIYHLEREQFVLLLPETNHQKLYDKLNNIKAMLESKPLRTQQNAVLKITLSMGLSHFAAGVTQPQDALLMAERSLFEAREQQYAFLSPGKALQTTFKTDQRNLWLLEQIRIASRQDQVEVHYQPIQTTQSGTILKYEALMRLRTEQGELIMPAEFMSLSKATQYYPKLSQQLIRKVVQTLAKQPKHMIFSLNLSALDIHHPEVLTTLIDEATTHQVTKQLVIEVVESEDFGNINDMLEIAKKLNASGFALAFDDFGSGYSNYQNIIQLAPYFSFLKIDGSIVQPSLTNPHYYRLIQSIKEMADSLELKTIAEFVDSEALAQELKTLEIDYLQGFYIGKPATAEIHNL